MQKIRIIISGRVQGVGFRYHTLNIARDLEIKGRVWNNDDGTVEILAQAETSTILEAFEKRLRTGNRWIHVSYLEVQAVNFKDFQSFEISAGENF